MKIKRANVFLVVVSAGIFLLAAYVGRDLTHPNLEFLPDMKYSPAYDAYSPNPNFANGRTLQAPLPGTIARGERPLHYGASLADAKRAGKELLNPFAGDKNRLRRSTRRGAKVYRVSCAVCHASSGLATDVRKLPLVQRSIFRPKALATGDSLKMKDGRLFHILTYGQGGMTSFKGQLTPEQRWDAVNYVRDMQRKHAAAEKRKKSKSRLLNPVPPEKKLSQSVRTATTQEKPGFSNENGKTP
ncbi:MAG: c-type cytochrome [Planctomycetaceae bacterium]